MLTSSGSRAVKQRSAKVCVYQGSQGRFAPCSLDFRISLVFPANWGVGCALANASGRMYAYPPCTHSQSDDKMCKRSPPYTLHTVQGCLTHRSQNGISPSASTAPLARPGKQAFLVSPASRCALTTTRLSCSLTGYVRDVGCRTHQQC